MAEQTLETERPDLRPKYEDVVSMDIMDGLQQFCDEFSFIMIPPNEKDIEYAREKQNKSQTAKKRLESKSLTLSLLDSLNLLIYELSDNLNKCIVRIEELQSAGQSLSVSIQTCGATVMHGLETRINEINSIFEQIDIVYELTTTIETEYVNPYKKRYLEVLTLCDEHRMIQKRLKEDPLGTIKKHSQKIINQNTPKIRNEINIQKEKFMKMKNNILSFSAKNVFSKLKNQRNESIESKENDNANAGSGDHMDQTASMEETQETLEEEEDEDLIRAIFEYEWKDLPVLSEWDGLMQEAKKRCEEKEQRKGGILDGSLSKDNLQQITIKWLSEHKKSEEEEIVDKPQVTDDTAPRNEKKASVDLP